ncbi:MAG: DNA-directed RNA polymerase [Thermofilum sp.]
MLELSGDGTGREGERMYKLVMIEDIVDIPPHLFGKQLEEAALEVLRETYEGRVVEGVGLVISVLSVEVSPEGYLTFGDPSSYHECRFVALVYNAIPNEVVEGEVVLVENIGLTVRLGVIDGFVHRSQVFPTKDVIYDRDQGVVIAESGKRVIRRGDIVRARVTGVSYDELKGILRVRLTMRAPYLGRLDHIREMIEKRKEADKSE